VVAIRGGDSNLGGFMPAYPNVVVAVDDTPAGARVVEVAALQAAETGGNLILVAATGGAEPALKRAAEACAEMGAPSVEAIARAGDPATVLAGVARDRGADLVVVGNHALSRLSGGREVVSKATFDVLIAHTTSHGWLKLVSRRHRHEPSTYQRTFLVGVHDTDHAMRAADRAGALSADLDAELILVGAYERTERPQLSGWKSLTVSQELGSAVASLGAHDSHAALAGLSQIETALSDGAARARAKGAEKVETVAVPGDPVQALLDTADERTADLVVVGNHPQAQGTPRLIGSISTRISRKSPTHVLLVH
jgi:nucleotide-binding universal stress UspA family protein